MNGTSTPSLDPPQSGERSWWKKPGAWIGGLFLAALTSAVMGQLTGVFDRLIDRVTETGAAVSVNSVNTFRSDATGSSVVFPAGTDFTTADLAELNAEQDSVAWLEGRGGVAVGTVYIQIALSGNRSAPVRITDISVSPTCGKPLDGLLFESPPAGADDSISVFFDLDDVDPTATLLGSDGKAEAYFPARTISLAEGEQQLVLVTATTQKQFCEFTVDLTVLEGDSTVVQRISMPDDTPFMVSASVPEREYESVYLGGVICPTWVKAGAAYFDGDYEKACHG